MTCALGLLASVASPVAAAPEPGYRRLLRLPVSRGPVSVGTPVAGRLIRASQLPARGRHYLQPPRFRARGTSFATDELIALIRHGAAAVALQFPGSQLVVGNLSRRHGGFIRFSRSHQSGRDADLLFYARYRGRPVTLRRLRAFGPDLRARAQPALTFDVARNWALVRALLTDPRHRIQWIIVAPHLEAALLDHARRLHESPDLRRRAQRVLHQPPGLRDHDNHFHLRLYCSLSDRLAGCRDLPPIRAGAGVHDQAVRRHLRVLLEGLTAPEPTVRRRILRRLIHLDARSVSPEIASLGLRDPDPEVRRGVLQALARWCPDRGQVVVALDDLLWRSGRGVNPGNGGRQGRAGRPGCDRGPPGTTRTCPSAGRPWDAHRSGRQIRLAYRALGCMPSRDVAAVLRRGLASTRWIRANVPGGAALPEAALAAHAVRGRRELALVPALLDALDHADPRVRRQAAAALRHLGNHRVGHRWGVPRRRPAHGRAVVAWRRWWRAQAGRSADALQWDGFCRRVPGFQGASTPRRLALLVRLTARQDELGDNAHAWLRRLAGPPVFRGPPPSAGRAVYWRWWLRTHIASARRQGAPRPAPPTGRRAP